MTSRKLRAKCHALYGETKGEKMYRFMKRVARIDFCIATGWSENEISIARSCSCAGQTFKVSEDYSTIIAPDGTEIEVRNARYQDTAQHLPQAPRLKYEIRNRHCAVDDVVDER